MIENKNYLLKAAATYGLSLGIYWIIKYMFFIFGLQVPFLYVVYWGMTMTVPYLAYILTKKYKQYIGGRISFFHAWQFGILIYFFAALVVSLVHYIFYRFIAPPDYIANAYKQTIEMMTMANVDAKLISTLKDMATPTSIGMTIQGIFNNVMYGIIFSIPVAAIVSRGYKSAGALNKEDKENTDNTIE